MYAIICGAGEVGRPIIEALQRERHEVAVIDHDPDLLGHLNRELEVSAFLGKASYPTILERAGAKNAELLIAATNDDEVNILCAQLASNHFRIPQVILRLGATQGRLATGYDSVIPTLVANAHTLVPEKRVAETIANSMSVTGAYFAQDLLGGAVKLIALYADENCPLVNSFLKHLTLLFPELAIRIVAIWRGGRGIIPTDEDSILVGDLVYFVVDATQIERAFSVFGKQTGNTKGVAIFGGGRIGAALIDNLLAQKGKNYKITVFETRKDRARQLAERFPTIQVLHGDVLLPATHQQGGVNFPLIDVALSLTDDDESNILAALMMKKSGVRHGYALVRNSSYSPLVAQLELDGMITPQNTTVATMLSLTRRGHVGGTVVLHDHFAEIMEVKLVAGCGAIGRRIGDLNLGRAVIPVVCSAQREVSFPYGNTLLEEDMWVVIAFDNADLVRFDRYFSPKVESGF